MRAIVWTAVITTSAAVAEVVIYRAVNQIGEKKCSRSPYEHPSARRLRGSLRSLLAYEHSLQIGPFLPS